MSSPPALEQISLSLSVEQDVVANATSCSQQRERRDLEIVRQSIQQQLGGPLPFNLHERHPPYNICMTSAFASHVKDAHVLLDKALVDIVERWFTDEEASFPARMPLEKHEEELLRWIDSQSPALIPAFGKRYGMWRTDYLIEKDRDGLESARICEINARIPFNGFWMSGLHEEATRAIGGGTKGFDYLNNFNVRLPREPWGTAITLLTNLRTPYQAS